MRVLLLNPPAEKKYAREGRCQRRAIVAYPPLTLAYIASVLRKENDILLLDSLASNINYKKLEQKVLKFKPELIILNTSTPTINNDLITAKKLKKKTGAISCIFGIHATYLADELIKLPEVDIIIKGEPEFTPLELTQKNFAQVPGIIYKNNGNIIENPERQLIDLDELPFPAWDMVNLNDYRMPVAHGKYILIMTERGCPYSCNFCVSFPRHGEKIRVRSIDSVLNEIKYVESLGIKNIFFFAETFTLNKKFVIDLCNEIIETNINIKWACNSRVDTIDKEMLEVMKKAGCWLISFGLESSDQGILDNTKKNIRVEQSRLAIEITKRSGIATCGYFQFGLPGETEKSMQDTIKFSLELPLDLAEFSIVSPQPGSRLFDELGIMSSSANWSDFDYAHNIVRKDLNLESRRREAHRKFYIRPRAFINMVRIFGVKSIINILKTGVILLINV
jgi:radical SAM superfamily enzyme YgiQ (UPF0313 family)